MRIKPFLSFQLLYCWSALAFLCRRSWGQLSLTNRDPSAKISRRDKRPKMVVPPLPPLCLGLYKPFFSICHLSRSLGVLLFSQLRTFCTYCTHTVIDRELESQQSYSQLLFPLELLLNGASSLTVNWQCTTGNIIRVWLWSWFPLDIQTSPVMKSSSQFVIFVSAVMVTVWGQVVHHWSLINSITGSATGLTNLFCHNKAD